MKIGCKGARSHCIPFPSSDTIGDKTGNSGKLRSPGRRAGLFKPWGQYTRTAKGGRIEGDAETERKSQGSHAQKEILSSSRQAHPASRDQPLFGVSKQAPTVCHDFRSNHCDPQASHATRSLWVSLSPPTLSRTKKALSKCRGRCIGFSWVYVWIGYCPVRRTSAIERAPNRR